MCHIAAETEAEAVWIAMQGYGYRWKIEEVHRQVKNDYNLEDVRLRRYTALKNFNVLFWITMSFLYHHLDGLSLDILQNAKIQLVYRPKKISEYIGFIFYKLSRALQSILGEIKLRKLRLKDKWDNSDQLILALE